MPSLVRSMPRAASARAANITDIVTRNNTVVAIIDHKTHAPAPVAARRSTSACRPPINAPVAAPG